MNIFRKKSFIILFSLVFVVAVGAIAVLTSQSRQLVLDDVLESLDFSPLVVTGSSSFKPYDYKTSVMGDGVILLTYIIPLDSDRSVTVSEYPQPSQFTDVPDFKEKFLEDVIQQTSSVSSAGGTIILGKMAKQNNQQMAVMLDHGLVVFLVPSTELSERDWRKIGDSLVVQRQ
ncbi:hypothetical protein EOL96_00845 [Candidatus Saccharibacteria bacterium]|nr:hypothetical protein [Candidatus Saccharibacteria bacterium]